MNLTRILLADDRFILPEAGKKLIEPACLRSGDGRAFAIKDKACTSLQWRC